MKDGVCGARSRPATPGGFGWDWYLCESASRRLTRRRLLGAFAAAASGAGLRIRELPPLPLGLAGQFVGVHGGRLIVAGGTFWDKPRWAGGQKQWSARIYTLGPGETAWRESGEQPEPLAYGGSVSTELGVLCIGGQGPQSVSPAVTLLVWDGVRVRARRFPELPEPRMMLGAAHLGETVFAACGQTAADRPACPDVWAFGLSGRNVSRGRWRAAEPVPAEGRILPVVASSNRDLFVASGAELVPGGPGPYRRRYLSDALCSSPQQGWRKLPDLPWATLGAPAITDARGSVLIAGGDDGSLANAAAELGARHPGFRRSVLRLEPTGWREVGALPEGLVTTGIARWATGCVIPGGEDRPGSRSARVFLLEGLLGCKI